MPLPLPPCTATPLFPVPGWRPLTSQPPGSSGAPGSTCRGGVNLGPGLGGRGAGRPVILNPRLLSDPFPPPLPPVSLPPLWWASAVKGAANTLSLP